MLSRAPCMCVAYTSIWLAISHYRSYLARQYKLATTILQASKKLATIIAWADS